MIALLFEVLPRPGMDQRYLELAASLKPALDANGGVHYLERFRSLKRERLLLSHQLWQDEASLARWRAHGGHYGVQTLGRTAVFEDYRLRVAPVVADHTSSAHTLSRPQQPYNDPARQAERHMVIVRTVGAPFERPDGEAFHSVYRSDGFLWLGEIASPNEGLDLVHAAARIPGLECAQLTLVSRDYGMRDRGEAPQYFPPTL